MSEQAIDAVIELMEIHAESIGKIKTLLQIMDDRIDVLKRRIEKLEEGGDKE